MRLDALYSDSEFLEFGKERISLLKRACPISMLSNRCHYCWLTGLQAKIYIVELVVS